MNYDTVKFRVNFVDAWKASSTIFLFTYKFSMQRVEVRVNIIKLSNVSLKEFIFPYYRKMKWMISVQIHG